MKTLPESKHLSSPIKRSGRNPTRAWWLLLVDVFMLASNDDDDFTACFGWSICWLWLRAQLLRVERANSAQSLSAERNSRKASHLNPSNHRKWQQMNTFRLSVQNLLHSSREVIKCKLQPPSVSLNSIQANNIMQSNNNNNFIIIRSNQF